MIRRLLTLTALLTVAVAATAWAAGVSPARGATRSALIRALVRQDGSSAGVRGVYVSGDNGVVCQKTPDAGLVRFLFHHSGAWHYSLTARGTHTGTAIQRRLEAACH